MEWTGGAISISIQTDVGILWKKNATKNGFLNYKAVIIFPMQLVSSSVERIALDFYCSNYKQWKNSSGRAIYNSAWTYQTWSTYYWSFGSFHYWECCISCVSRRGVCWVDSPELGGVVTVTGDDGGSGRESACRTWQVTGHRFVTKP